LVIRDPVRHQRHHLAKARVVNVRRGGAHGMRQAIHGMEIAASADPSAALAFVQQLQTGQQQRFALHADQARFAPCCRQLRRRRSAWND
jgi:hypothetical protein